MNFISINENIGLLSKNTVEELGGIINDYISKIYKYGIDDIDMNTELGVLLVLAEAREFFNNREQCDEFVWEIMSAIREQIYKGYYINRLGLCEGLCNVASVTRFYYTKTNYYSKFLSALEEMIINETEKRLQLLNQMSYQQRASIHFDVIYGMSGIAQYLLKTNEKAILFEISNYLCALTNQISYKGKKVPGWFVEHNNIIGKIEKNCFKTGEINYGMAHGITGVLAVLIKIAKKNINVGQVEKAMANIVKELEKAKQVSDLTCFPEIVSPEDYINNNFYENYNTRMSWCYGSITILYVLHAYYQYKQDEEKCKCIIDELIKIAEQGNKCWKLYSPIVCHGFAGTAHIFKLLYKKTGDPIIKMAYEKLIRNTIVSYNANYKYGFRDIYYEDGDRNKLKKEDKNTFLEGGSGIISVILGFLSEMEGVSSLLILDLD